MTPTKRKSTLTGLRKWLESRFHEIGLKLDHILFRLREQDPSICHLEVVDCSVDNEESIDESTDI